MRHVQDSATTIKPQTDALERYIQASVQRVLSRGDAVPGDGLLFLGNWHDAMPRLIFQDPVLQPVDTRIWGVIKIAASGAGPTAFPSYKRIAGCANVGSEATVARSMAILRATRWLSLCRRVRDSQGRFRGNVYALHDEPLPLADALHLDQEYMEFLEQARTHGHPHVRKVVAAVRATIADDLHESHHVLGDERPMERRLQAISAAQGNAHRFFAFSAHQLQKLKAVPENTPLQNLKSEPLQKLKSGSSSYIYKKTTTTTQDTAIPRARTRAEQAAADLALPASLSPNERHLTRLCLKHAPEGAHQDILDEWAGRLLAAQQKGRPIDNPIGYLAKLCKAARDGEFTVTSLGLRAREQRRQAIAHRHATDLSRDRAPAEMQAVLEKCEQSNEQGAAGTPEIGDGPAIRTLPGVQAPLLESRPAERDGGTITAVPRSENSPYVPPHSPGDGAAISTAKGLGAPTPGTHRSRFDGAAITTSPSPPLVQREDRPVDRDGGAITVEAKTYEKPSRAGPPWRRHDPVRERALAEMRVALARRGQTAHATTSHTPGTGDGGTISGGTGPPNRMSERYR